MAEPIRKDRPEPGGTPAEREAGEPARQPRNLIGTAFRRVDGRAKVTGRTLFADDLAFPRLCYLRLVRSTVPHARVRGIDLAAAERVPGVLGFLTGADFPIPFGILPVSQDEHALCPDRVRFVGDPVAAVAAVTEDAAWEAALAVEVDYEPLPTVGSIDEALATPEPRLHDYGDHGNVHKQVSMRFGDVEAGFAAADLVLEDTVFYEGNTHLPMEQHAAVAVARGRRPGDRLLLDPDSALPAPRAGQGARAAGLAGAGGGLPQRRRLRRQERPLQPRDRRRPDGAQARPAGQGDADPRGGLLLPPRSPPGADAGARPASPATAR